MTVHHGDCLDVMKRLVEDGVTVDSCVTDPPYHLTSIVKRFGKPGSAPAQFGTDGAYARASAGFMGKQWDGGDVAFRPETWALVYDLLKPGAHLAAFSGTRTYHRMACAIEDAGFEIRDQLAWAYGSGFPKSHNLDGDWQGWGTALKPAWEPICLTRKPLIGTVAANVLAYGTGAINVDGCRIETADGYAENAVTQGINTARTSYEHRRERRTFEPSQSGRWPANLIHDGSNEVLAGFPVTSSGEFLQHHRAKGKSQIGTFDIRDRSGEDDPTYGDSGSAARFFYCAKAGADDRFNSKHPTVKPVALMRWLCRLITPPGGVVLDPFAGTGTTGIAAIREGFDYTLIEREDEYHADIQRRIAALSGLDTPLFAEGA